MSVTKGDFEMLAITAVEINGKINRDHLPVHLRPELRFFKM